MLLSFTYDVLIIANRIAVFDIDCDTRPRGRLGLMFDCQTQKQKPQGMGQNGHFLEFSRP